MAAFFIPEAAAAPQCGQYGEIKARLWNEYKEIVTAFGLGANGKTVVELFQSPKGTFSVVVRNVQGRACVTQAGKHWKVIRKMRGRREI